MDLTAETLGGDTGRCYTEKENKDTYCTKNTKGDPGYFPCGVMGLGGIGWGDWACPPLVIK